MVSGSSWPPGPALRARARPEAITKKASAGSPSFTISLPNDAETGTKLSATTRRSSVGIIWRRGRESRTSRPSPGAVLATHAPGLGQLPLDRLERTRGRLVPDVALGMGTDHGIALGGGTAGDDLEQGEAGGLAHWP